ncbi:MAG: phytoene desaturase family protein [Candidatus Dormibacteraceae bacterium]
MSRTADIVVAGAGHNSLITAAYLAKAGYECLVLDARPIPGGGASTEELILPGYMIDTCSTGHTLIRVNPLLVDDELGLRADYGLQYVEPDPVGHVALPDGEHLTIWRDMERTCEEIAHFSQRDADAYRRLIADYDQVKGAFGATRFLPPGFGPSLEERLLEIPGGRRWLRINAMSAWDVIRHEFEDRHVQAFMVWMALQTVQAVDSLGTGSLAYSIIYGRQQRSWSIPLGGSGVLTAGLVRFLEARGSTVLCDRRVTRLVLEDGRCTGVETEDGERYLARTAVVSTIHVKHLLDMAPAEAWGEEFRYGVDTYDIGITNMGAYFAATEPPRFTLRDGGTRTATSAGVVGWPEDVIRTCRDIRDGRFSPAVSWLLVATPSLVDPSRAPDGNHTVKVLSPQSHHLPEGETDWDTFKERHARFQLEHLRRFAPNFTDDVILGSLVKSPFDFEHTNPHMIKGTFHGGDRGAAQSGGLRPVAGFGQHRMPIPGLYQTGGTTHPGGSITGAPGRNAAMVLLLDLGTSLEEVLSGAGRAPAPSR